MSNTEFESELPRLIVIDGEPGAGKTTQAGLIANRLGYTNVITGMLFCAAAEAVYLSSVNSRSELELEQAALQADIAYELQPGTVPYVSVNGIDVSGNLFSQRNKSIASRLSSISTISVALNDRLRPLLSSGRWVFDRGLSSFPDADLKIWLDANPYARAVRRCGQLAMQGKHVPLSKILAEHTKREQYDAARRALPPGTARIDTSYLDIEAVYAQIANRILYLS